jgi:hypothetical protein
MAELDRWSKADEVGRIEELGRALLSARDRPWTFTSVLDRVERLLALTPSPARTAAMTRLARQLPAARLRRTAAMLAQAQDAEVLLHQARSMSLELRACLLHELVLRGVAVGSWDLHGHPLSALPLDRLPGEDRLPLTHYSADGQSAGLPFGGGGRLITSAGETPKATRETTPPTMTAAVTTWLTESNGKAEAAVFTLESPLTSVGIRTLESLGLDSLAGNGLALTASTLDEVVPMLFAAAANGGAYDHGAGGAYGRAATWATVQALAAGEPAASRWWTFAAANDWFHRVAWDLGVVCVRADSRSMAILAATDED